MQVSFSVRFQVDDERSEMVELGMALVREEADAFACAVKRALTEAGLEVTEFHAEYE